MSNTVKTNSAFERLSKVTGLPEGSLEILMDGEFLPDALSKYISNLSKCLESFEERLERHETHKANEC